MAGVKALEWDIGTFNRGVLGGICVGMGKGRISLYGICQSFYLNFDKFVGGRYGVPVLNGSGNPVFLSPDNSADGGC